MSFPEAVVVAAERLAPGGRTGLQDVDVVGSGQTVKKDLKMWQHICGCGVDMDGDFNAAINVLKVWRGTPERLGKPRKRLLRQM